MRGLRGLTIGCIALLWAGAAQADFVTINFDPQEDGPRPPNNFRQFSNYANGFTLTDGFFPGMIDSVGSFVRSNTMLSNQLESVVTTLTSGISTTAIFSTLGNGQFGAGNAFVALVTLPPGSTSTPRNGIGGAYNFLLDYPNSEANAIQVRWNTLANYVEISKDTLPTTPTGGTVFMQALDRAGANLGTVVSIADGPNVGPLIFGSLGSATFNIGGIKVWSTGTAVGQAQASVGFDSLRYNIVPEPPSVILMGLGGLGVVGGAFLRRRFSR